MPPYEVDLEQYNALLVQIKLEKDENLEKVGDRQQTNTTQRVTQVVEASDLPEDVRRSGMSGDPAQLEFQPILAGVGRVGGGAETAKESAKATEGVETSARENVGEPTSRTLTSKSTADVANAVRGSLSEQSGECPGVWDPRGGQDPCVMRDRTRIDQKGDTSAIPRGPRVDATLAQSEEGVDAGEGDQAIGKIRDGIDRRSGICATGKGGDGGVVHVPGGEIREKERDAQQQPGVLTVGAAIQGSNDDRSGDRQADTPLRDPGVDRRKLPYTRSKATETEEQKGIEGDLMETHPRAPPFCTSVIVVGSQK